MLKKPVPRRALAMAAAVLAFLAADVTVASAGCNPGRPDNYQLPPYDVHYGQGWGRPAAASGYSWDWVKSDIDVQDPYIAIQSGLNGSQNFVWSWIMMQNDAGSHWAQIGPATINDGKRYDFIQCWVSPTDVVNFFDGPNPHSLGSQPTYKIVNDASNSNKKFYVNGSQTHACTNTLFTPGIVEALDETLTHASQFPGSVSNHVMYDNMQARRGGTTYDFLGSGAIFYEPNGTGTGNQLSYNHTTNLHMETWDSYCS